MSMIVALFLGLIQGITEFLPVSSTAHLILAAEALNVNDPAHPERMTAFIATIQMGTLVAVLTYFRNDLAEMAIHFLRDNVSVDKKPFARQSANSKLAWFVAIGSVPIVVIGFAAKSLIEGNFTKDPRVIAVGLIVVSIAIWWAERVAKRNRTASELTLTDSVLIGLAQCLALIPGASRSGSTIMAGLFRGLTREHAARFSFLLSIPAITGAGVYQFIKEMKYLSWEQGGAELLTATVAAGVSGYFAVAMLMRFLKSKSMGVFIIYRIALGLVLLLVACTPSEQKATPLQVLTKPDKPVTDTQQNTVAAEIVQPKVTDTVTVKTTAGVFTMVLYGNDAPKTVANIIGLIKQKYYNGVLVHRVSKDFIVQMGDAATKEEVQRLNWGKGGKTANGKELVDELDSSLPSAKIGYQEGVVAMANKQQQPNSGTSQFFICLKKASVLPYQYTIFGRIVEGLDVVRDISYKEIEPGPLGAEDGMPRKPIRITSVLHHKTK